MLDAAQTLGRITARVTYEQYLQNQMLRLAVERGLQIIGEAARRVSESARQDHPQIPWQQIIGLRNVLVHEYDEIQHDILWKITTEDIPPLIEALELIVPPPPDEPTT